MLCLMAGCTHTSHHPQLVAVDSMLTSQPDSALTQLKKILPSFGGTEGGASFGGIEGGASTADRMYYYLLLADACNKCYDTLPSDSIMHAVADYYDRHGTANEQVRAHYLLGCTYRDMGEAPQALDCYHTAISRADTTSKDCNYRLLMSVYGQMADIFHKQNLPKDEIWALEQSGQCDLRIGDTIGYIRSQELRVRPYTLLGDTAKVFETIKKTKSLYIEHGSLYLAIRENIIPIYYSVERGELDQARTLMQEYEKGSLLFDEEGNIAKGREAYYFIKGTYYIKKNRLDPAEHYMRKLLRAGNDVDAYRGLLTVYKQRKNADSIIKYARLYEDAIDTLNNQRRTETIGQMSSMYNYQRYQLKAEREEQRANRIKWTLAAVLLLSLILMAMGLSLYRRFRAKKLHELSQLHTNYIQAQAECIKQQEELLLLQEDKSQLQEKKEQEIRQLQKAISGYKEKLLATKEADNTSQEQYKELINTFHQKATGILGRPKPTAKEWRELLRLFKMNTSIEQAVICKEGVLSKMELQVCLLLLLEFTNSDLCVLLDTTPQRITNIKSRINKKLFREASASTLQANLKYLSANV